MSKRYNENHLVIGNLGQIGSALTNLLRLKNPNIYGIDKQKINKKIIARKHRDLKTISFDFIHICIPYTDSFNRDVIEYSKVHGKPHTILIIHSTVLPTTTEFLTLQLNPVKVVYSPIRGVHPNIKDRLLKWVKYCAGYDESALLESSMLFESMDMKTRVIQNPTALEFAKHFSTLMFGYSLAFTQHLVVISKQFKFHPSIVHDFVNEVGEIAYDRKIYPYIEAIGGHCVLSNAEMIKEMSEFAKLLLKFNEDFKKDIGKRIDIKK